MNVYSHYIDSGSLRFAICNGAALLHIIARMCACNTTTIATGLMPNKKESKTNAFIRCRLLVAIERRGTRKLSPMSNRVSLQFKCAKVTKQLGAKTDVAARAMQ
jgi:hypothetical protein